MSDITANVTTTTIKAGVTTPVITLNLASVQGGTLTKITENLALSSVNISNKYVDLAHVPKDNTAVGVFPVVGIKQLYAIDYTVITDGTNIKRLNWTGLGLETLLATGDIISVDYIY